MATTKVLVFRKWHGQVPEDESGKPIPKEKWPKKRKFSWAVRWFGSNGKRYSRSFKTRKEALRFSERQQQEVRKGKPDTPVNISLEDFTREHLKLMKGQISYSYLKDQKRVLHYLKDIIGNVSIQKITPQLAEQYVKVRSETGISVSSINKEIKTLKRIFTLAHDRRGYLLDENHCFKKIKSRKVSQKPIRYVTLSEFNALIDAVPDMMWKVFLNLIYTTALRLEEASQLTWCDIDFDQGILWVSAKRKSKDLVLWEPKDHELRHIPLCEEMIDLLTQWQNEAPEKVPYMFLSQKRYQHVIKLHSKGMWHDGMKILNNQRRILGEIRSKAGVAHFTFHDMRRTCLTNWARKMSPHIVKNLAGHSSLETTMKYYLAVLDDDVNKVRDVSSKVLSNLDSDQTDPKQAHKRENQDIKKRCQSQTTDSQDVTNGPAKTRV